MTPLGLSYQLNVASFFAKNVASVLCNRNLQASGLKAGLNVNRVYIHIIQLSTFPWSGQLHKQTPRRYTEQTELVWTSVQWIDTLYTCRVTAQH